MARRKAHYVAKRFDILAKAKASYRTRQMMSPEELDAARKYRRLQYFSNRDKHAAWSKEYARRHPDVVKRKSSRYCARHRALLRKRSREYYQANREKEIKRAIVRNHIRRAQKNNTTIDEAGIKQWMREVRSKAFARCYWCGTKVVGRRIYFDHITPLSKSGTHTIGNLCASCCHCNQTKHARVIADWIVGGQTFLPL